MREEEKKSRIVGITNPKTTTLDLHKKMEGLKMQRDIVGVVV